LKFSSNQRYSINEDEFDNLHNFVCRVQNDIPMKRIIIVYFFIVAFYNVKAQYHLLYFSEDSITKMQFDARAFFSQGKCEESILTYKKLARIDSLKKSSIYNIGLNYSKMKVPDSASFYFFNALKLGCDSAAIFDELVFMYNVEMKNYEKAYAVLTEMIGYWPKNSDLYKRRASLRVSWKRDFEGYDADMNKAIELGDIEAKERLEREQKAVEVFKKNMNERK